MREINDNSDRADRAAYTLEAYTEGEGRDIEDSDEADEIVSDLLCDLQHLFPKMDLAARLKHGLWHYREELKEEAQDKAQAEGKPA